MTTTTVSNTSTTKVTLAGQDQLIVTSTGVLKPGGPAVTWSLATPGAGVSIDNAGQIAPTSGRAFDTSGTAATGAASFSLTNETTGTIAGASDAASTAARCRSTTPA